MRPKSIPISEERRVPKAIEFRGLAVQDYLAARVLLNSQREVDPRLGAQLVPQGTILASTAIEKYFKSIIALTGSEVRGHLHKLHLDAIRNQAPALFARLNASFLEMLQRVYPLRYLDVPPGFTICLARRPILAELDFTVATIEGGFQHFRNGQRCKTIYDHLVETKDPRLFENNYLLAGLDKIAFIEQQQDFVYAMRMDENLGLLELCCVAERIPADGDFLKPGLLPNPPRAAAG